MTIDRTDDFASRAEDRDPDAEAAELEEQIAVTRGQMAETVQAIGEKLSPTNIVAGAKESVREATIGRVEDVADAAGEMIGDSVRGAQDAGSGLLDTIRSNPIPAAMTAIGIAWLWRSRSTNGHHNGWNGGNGRSWEARSRESGPYGRSEFASRQSWDADAGRGGSAMGGAGRAAGDAAAQGGQTIGDAAARAGSAVGGLQEGASRAMDDVARQAATTTRQAQGQIERLFDDSPLVVGAAAVGIGALAASLIPNTEFEQRLYGQPRDQLIGQVEQVAQDALDQVDTHLQASSGSKSTSAGSTASSGSTGSSGRRSGASSTTGSGTPASAGSTTGAGTRGSTGSTTGSTASSGTTTP